MAPRAVEPLSLKINGLTRFCGMRSLTDIYSEFPHFPTRVSRLSRLKGRVFIFLCGMVDPELLQKRGAMSSGGAQDLAAQSAAGNAQDAAQSPAASSVHQGNVICYRSLTKKSLQFIGLRVRDFSKALAVDVLITSLAS
jgi:hypothetical protein